MKRDDVAQRANGFPPLVELIAVIPADLPASDREDKPYCAGSPEKREIHPM